MVGHPSIAITHHIIGMVGQGGREKTRAWGNGRSNDRPADLLNQDARMRASGFAEPARGFGLSVRVSTPTATPALAAGVAGAAFTARRSDDER